jgi:hypothetical protein
MRLDIPPYDNAPAAAFATIRNATTDMACTLRGPDNPRIHTFTVDGPGVPLGIDSGSRAAPLLPVRGEPISGAGSLAVRTSEFTPGRRESRRA